MLHSYGRTKNIYVLRQCEIFALFLLLGCNEIKQEAWVFFNTNFALRQYPEDNNPNFPVQ